MRRRRRLPGLLLAALLAAPAEVPAADDSPRDAMRVVILSHRLAAAEFAQREQAEAELLSLGVDALPALRGAVEQADLEARYRLLRIIQQLEHAERATALEAFRAGTPPRDPALLAAWNACRQLTGDSRDSRDLFAEMVRTEPWLVPALSGPGEQLRELFEQRCADIHLQRMQRQDSQRGVATVAALLLAGRQPDCYPSASAVTCITHCIQEGAFLQTMERPDRPAPLERLVAVWISDGSSSNPQQRLQLAAKFDLVEGVDVALQIIRQRLYGPQLSYAVMYLAKTGDRAHLHELELLLEDATELQVHRQSAAAQAGVLTFSSRVQDVALVALLQMTEQNPRDYGFSGLRDHPQTIYATATIGFETAEQRGAAVAQWKRWSAANLKAVQPVVEQAAAGHST